MRNCEYVWAPVRAQQVSELVEKSTGQPCPCKQGKPCPFVRLEATVTDLPEPRARDDLAS